MKKIILVAFVMLVIQNRETISDFINPPAKFVAKQNLQVTLYTTSWCAYCRKTRRLLDDHNIEYTEYDIETSQKGQEEYEKLNGRGVPLLLINGKLVRGYDRSRILELAGS